ncbi:MAG: hypothetical protein QXE31_02055 [Candidatus Woesearchaeota archaeon]
MIVKYVSITLKDKIVKILQSIFGDSVKKIVDENYNDEKELIELAYHMLVGYMGKENAINLLLKENIISEKDLKKLN